MKRAGNKILFWLFALIYVVAVRPQSIASRTFITAVIYGYIFYLFTSSYPSYPEKIFTLFLPVLTILYLFKNEIFNLNFPKIIFVILLISPIIIINHFKLIWQKIRCTYLIEDTIRRMSKVLDEYMKVKSKVEEFEIEIKALESKKRVSYNIYNQLKSLNSVVEMEEVKTLIEEGITSKLNIDKFLILIKDENEIKVFLNKNIPEHLCNYIKCELEEKKERKPLPRFSEVFINNTKFSFVYIPMTYQEEKVIGCFVYLSSHKIEEVPEEVFISIKHFSLSLRRTFLYMKTKELARRDGLTGLFLRRVFNEELEREFKRFQRYKTKLALVMLDIDHFKDVNDTYGHLFGDKVLTRVGEIIKEETRTTDIAARYGGEEFGIICPEINKREAYKIAENIRKSLLNEEFITEKGEIVKVTISGGVAEADKNISSSSELIKRADQALYQAKETGRNKVIIFE